jgi:hypothetical protein
MSSTLYRSLPTQAINPKWDLPDSGTDWDKVGWQCGDENLANRRFDHRGANRELVREHKNFRLQRFLKHKTTLADETASSLLRMLGATFGLSWIDLSAMINVSVPAIRKWRLGGDISPANNVKLLELAAFFKTLQDLRVTDPATWIHLRLAPDSATVTPLHLYSESAIPTLLAYVESEIEPLELLTELEPEWMQKYRTDFTYKEIAPGVRAITKKEA